MRKQTLKGTADYLPKENAVRNRLMLKIRNTYESYGFSSIATPMLESIENLDNSDGGENLKLIFRIMKRGEKLKKAIEAGSSDLADMGLRYDLTLPLARFFANNRNELPSVCKFIQMGDVFRAEQPQNGRMRQFTQCDIDIIGNRSNTAEIELICATCNALENIGMTNFTVNINDRRILSKLLSCCGFEEESFNTVCISFDKLDKIGAEGVVAELKEKELNEGAVAKFAEFLSSGDFSLDYVTKICGECEEFAQVKSIIDSVESISGGKYSVKFNLSLVRGQSYYTGTVFEVVCPEYGGAIAGGGRYDNLIGKFTGEVIPAVGFSIGFERIFGILMSKNASADAVDKLAVLCTEEQFAEGMKKAAPLRERMNVSVVLKASKVGKQFGALEAQGYTYAAFFDDVEDESKWKKLGC